MTRFLVFGLLLGGCDLGVEVGSGNVDSEVRPLTEIVGVQVRSGFDVEVRQNVDLDLIEVTCDDNLLGNIQTDIEDGVLVIKTERNQAPRAVCHVLVKTSSTIDSLTASGSGTLSLLGAGVDLTSVSLSGSGSVLLVDGAGSQPLSVDASGSGSVELGTIGGDLTASLSGSGSIEANGTINNVQATISGSGNAHLADLEALNGDVTISGSGQVEITATSSVRVRISGSGSCEVHGQPTDRNIDTTGSGTVEFL